MANNLFFDTVDALCPEGTAHTLCICAALGVSLANVFILFAIPFLLYYLTPLSPENLHLQTFGIQRYPWRLSAVVSVLLAAVPAVVLADPLMRTQPGFIIYVAVAMLSWSIVCVGGFRRWGRTVPDYLLYWNILVGCASVPAATYAALELANNRGAYEPTGHVAVAALLAHCALSLLQACVAVVVLSNAGGSPWPKPFKAPPTTADATRAAPVSVLWCVLTCGLGSGGKRGGKKADADGARLLDADSAKSVPLSARMAASGRRATAAESAPLLLSPSRGGSSSKLYVPPTPDATPVVLVPSSSSPAASSATEVESAAAAQDAVESELMAASPVAAARTLLGMDRRFISPVDAAALPSRLSFYWLQALMALGYSRPLEASDLPPLPWTLRSRYVYASFRAAWDAVAAAVGSRQQAGAAGASSPPLGRVLRVAFSANFYAAMILKLTFDVLQFLSPLLLNVIVVFLQDTVAGQAPPAWVGFCYVALLLANSALQTAFLHQYFYIAFNLGQQLRSAVSIEVYRKSLRLSLTARQSQSFGTLTNLMSTDAKRLQDLMAYVMTVVSGPWQIFLAMLLLWQQIGVSVFAGLGVMILVMPLNAVLARRSQGLQKLLMKTKDQRVSLTNEALSGIRLIKLAGWEDDFMRRITGLRDEELERLYSYLLQQQVFMVVFQGMPLLVTLASFGMYTGINGAPPSAAELFTALSLFSLLRFPLAMIPSVINSVLEARVSLRRLQDFLDADEVDATSALHLPQAATTAASSRRSAASTAADADAVALEVAATDFGGLPPPPAHVAIEAVGAGFVWQRVESAGSEAVGGSSKKKKDASGGKAGASDAKPATKPAAAANASAAPFALHDVNMTVPGGALCVVVGVVGAGKTSLLHALLGEMVRTAGRVCVRGRVAYAPQAAFVLNASLRDNVLFGLPADEARYAAVIAACQLLPDIALLPSGDATEIGEKGIGLSGGQQARVGLARAVYADPDVLIADDVLAAVDAHVGAAIYAQVFCGPLLAGKTRVLVTHGLQYIASADRIVVLADGRVAEQGTYAELVTERRGPVLARMLETFQVEAVDSLAAGEGEGEQQGGAEGTAGARKPHADTAGAAAATAAIAELAASAAAAATAACAAAATALVSVKAVGSAAAAGAKPAESKAAEALRTLKSGKQTTEETRERGRVKLSVFAAYISAVGGWPMTSWVMGLFVLFQVASQATSVWLSFWSGAITPATPSSTNFLYLGIYAAISIGSLLVLVLQRIVSAVASIRASRSMHAGLIKTLLHLPLSFIDTTPLGRILNRCSGDMYVIDEQIQNTISSFVSCVLSVLCTAAIIAYTTPWFLVGIVPLGAFYVYTQRYYVATSRELQRLDSASKSPIFSNFAETLSGTVVIRAFTGAVARFDARNARLIDANQAAYFCNTSANRWLAVRLEMVGTLITASAALFAVLAAVTNTADDADPTFPALAGLSLSMALSVTQTLNWAVRMSSDLETQIVAVERVKEYAELATEHEVPVSGEPVTPPANWPQRGAIKISDLKLKYRFTTPYVLHGISCDIQPGEHIGIVGRTGAGKSSLINALFLTADVQEGAIEIDGINIARVPLSTLRSRLTIIPQVPVLFSGPLRRQLDVLGTSTDADIWAALELVSMREFVAGLPKQLDAPVSDGGANFSAGQRQLLTVARALLRKTRVVVLDEASSSVDVMADAILQRALRTEFRDCTVLTIAHRVNTIVDSSRVMVLADGRVTEFDAPQTLMRSAGSDFARMVAESAAVGESLGGQ